MNKQQFKNFEESVKTFRRSIPNESKTSSESYTHFVKMWVSLYHMIRDDESLLEHISTNDLLESLVEIRPDFTLITTNKELTKEEKDDLLFVNVMMRDNSYNDLNELFKNKIINFSQWRTYDKQIFEIWETTKGEIEEIYNEKKMTDISDEYVRSKYYDIFGLE